MVDGKIQVVTVLGLESNDCSRVVMSLLMRVGGVESVRSMESEGVFEVVSRQFLTPEQLAPSLSEKGYVVSSVI